MPTLHKEDTLGRRVRLLLLVVADTAGLAAVFLQLTPQGFPLNGDMLNARLESAIVEEFWFVPLCAMGGLVLLLGGVLGALASVRWALWLYGALAILSSCGRLYLTFEMSMHEGATPTRPLLIDMLVVTVCLFIELAAVQEAASLALIVRFNIAVHKQRHHVRRHAAVACASSPAVAPQQQQVRDVTVFGTRRVRGGGMDTLSPSRDSRGCRRALPRMGMSPFSSARESEAAGSRAWRRAAGTRSSHEREAEGAPTAAAESASSDWDGRV